MDKKDVIHVYNEILLKNRKEKNWVICRDVDGLRNCHTEWSNSERENQTLYINAYMKNLEKWHKWTYLQSSSRVTDVENEFRIPSGRGVGWFGRLWLTYINNYV